MVRLNSSRRGTLGMESEVNQYEYSRDQVQELYEYKSQFDFLLFIRGITIPSATGPQLFRSCMKPFQRDFFEDVAPSLHAIQQGDVPKARRFWLERTKKASKDADLALCIIWLVAFTEQPFLGQVCACDRGQASIIKSRILDILYYNPWLNKYVDVQQNKILSTRYPKVVRTIIEATDSAGGAHGETPDLLILNELVHVVRWETMETHMNNADGTPRGIVIVSTNAGFTGTKAYQWRQTAIDEKQRWKVHIWSDFSPWANKEDIADAKKRNSLSEYRRLWKGVWVSGKGDALDEEDIDRCFRFGHEVLDGPEKGWIYLAAFDLGVSHDHAGITIVGVNEQEQRVRVGYVQGFRPDTITTEGNREVDLSAVEQTCYLLWKTFKVIWFGYDPAAGGSFMAQRLGNRGVPVAKMSFGSGSNLNAMAEAFMKLVKTGSLECYEDVEGRLRADFGKFHIVRSPWGYKLKAVSDETGHADVGTALVIALPKALELIGGLFNVGIGDQEIGVLDDVELTEEQVKAMPKELRDLYDMEDDYNSTSTGRWLDGDED